MKKGQSPFSGGSFSDWLMPRVDVTEAGYLSPCWLWNLALTKKGYARWRLPRQFTPDKKTLSVHRAVFENLSGPIPAGLVIDHLCRNRSCQNPAHLEAVTAAENTRRGINQFVPMTACLAGHSYADGSSYIDRKGHRICRICRRISGAAHSARLKASLGQHCRCCSNLLSVGNSSGFCSRCVNVRLTGKVVELKAKAA